jgi:hypothetical protein
VVLQWSYIGVAVVSQQDPQRGRTPAGGDNSVTTV